MDTSQSGVYAITNIISKKVYIGSTVDFERRWSEHKSSLRHGKHINPHLQSSWNKYGGNAFEFSILEYLDNHEKLAKVEQFWMDTYREEGKNLYNIGLAVNCPWRGQIRTKEHSQKISEALMGHPSGMLGKKHSKETRQRISEANIGRKASKETLHKMRKSSADRWYREILNFIRTNREWLGTAILREHGILQT